jgi:hypothetical protein
LRTFAAVKPDLDRLNEGLTAVVQSGTQTPPPPQPVHPLAVMQTQPDAHSAEELHGGTSEQNMSCAHTAVFSVVVKQLLPSGPAQPHEGNPLVQLPAVVHVVHSPPVWPFGVRQHDAGGTCAPHGGRQTGSPQQVVLLQVYPGAQSVCPS